MASAEHTGMNGGRAQGQEDTRRESAGLYLDLRVILRAYLHFLLSLRLHTTHNHLYFSRWPISCCHLAVLHHLRASSITCWRRRLYHVVVAIRNSTTTFHPCLNKSSVTRSRYLWCTRSFPKPEVVNWLLKVGGYWPVMCVMYTIS